LPSDGSEARLAPPTLDETKAAFRAAWEAGW